MSETIFSKIITGEIPSHKIYEDDRVLAFLDINPKNEGHTLVIPKKPVEFVWDLDDDDYQYLMLVSKRLAKHLRASLPYHYIQLSIVGTDVPHAHVHLIPFNTDHALDHGLFQTTSEELAMLADRLKISAL